MPEQRQVRTEVADYLAEQLGTADTGVLAEYGERDGTARSHAGEIRQDGTGGTSPRSGTTGEGPKTRLPRKARATWSKSPANGDAGKRRRGNCRRSGSGGEVAG